MKILAAGDIHGDIDLAKALSRKANENDVELIVLCGDIVKSEDNVENIIGQFSSAKAKVLLVPGNHETLATADFLAQVYNQTNLHGYSVKKDNIGFFGCSAVNIGLHTMHESDIFDTLKLGFKYIKDARKKVMVTHTHPSGTTMERLSNIVKGSDGVRKALEEFRPDILLCSHVHEAEGLEEMVGPTKVINVGREGKIIDL